MPLSEPGTVREARSGGVQNAGGEEVESREGRDGGVGDTPLTRQEKEKGDVGVETVEEEEGGKMESFFCDVHEFLTDYTIYLIVYQSPLLFPLLSRLPLFPLFCSRRDVVTVIFVISLLWYFITLFCLGYVL